MDYPYDDAPIIFFNATPSGFHVAQSRGFPTIELRVRYSQLFASPEITKWCVEHLGYIPCWDYSLLDSEDDPTIEFCAAFVSREDAAQFILRWG